MVLIVGGYLITRAQAAKWAVQQHFELNFNNGLHISDIFAWLGKQREELGDQNIPDWCLMTRYRRQEWYLIPVHRRECDRHALWREFVDRRVFGKETDVARTVKRKIRLPNNARWATCVGPERVDGMMVCSWDYDEDWTTGSG